MNNALTQYFLNNLSVQRDEVLAAFVEEINNNHQAAVVGIVFYGSCMRTRTYKDAMLDFYVVVDNYSNAYSNYWYRWANWLLAPNVFYQQTIVDGVSYTAKYAVISEKFLLSEVQHSFHSYFWARFVQPMSCIYSRDDTFKNYFVDVQSNAANSFYSSVSPILKSKPSSRDFWLKGLQLTYAAEIRAEAESRANLIYENDCDYYDGLYSSISSSDSSSNSISLLSKFKWKLRILYGKFLSVLRLMKATTTFEGGVDYIAWKIERHTGQAVTVNEKMRKYPWLYIWPVVFKLIKNGIVR